MSDEEDGNDLATLFGSSRAPGISQRYGQLGLVTSTREGQAITLLADLVFNSVRFGDYCKVDRLRKSRLSRWLRRSNSATCLVREAQVRCAARQHFKMTLNCHQSSNSALRPVYHRSSSRRARLSSLPFERYLLPAQTYKCPTARHANRPSLRRRHSAEERLFRFFARSSSALRYRRPASLLGRRRYTSARRK